MRSFEEWLKEPVKKAFTEEEEEEPIYIDCWGCGKFYRWEYASEDYSPDKRESNVCGGTPYCLP